MRFDEQIAAILKAGEAEPEMVKIAIGYRRDEVASRLKETLQPGVSFSDRLEALIDFYFQATFEMVFEASQCEDRIEFAEAEMKARAVDGALNRAAEALSVGDVETTVAAMLAVETVLGMHVSL